MSYELILKKQRQAEGQERVTISSTGRQFFLSSAVVEKYLADSTCVQIYVDRDTDDAKIRVALRPLRREDEHTYSIVRPKKSRSAYVTAKATLTSIGYKNSTSVPLPISWVERNIGGRKVGVLEFEIDRKYCKQ